jgi:hypothetical protein
MRSLALPVVYVTSTLIMSACGTSAPPEDEDTAAVLPVGSDDDPDEPRAIVAGIDIGSPRCDTATASFEVLARYADDSTFVPNRRCRVTFDDGAVSELCAGEHTFASAGAHTFTVEVEDLDTGATARTETTRTIAAPLEIDLELDVPTCGLEVGFRATSTPRAEVHVTMSPPETVVEPHVAGFSGTFQALQPGSYTITMTAEDERQTGPICLRSLTRTVELRACDDHDCDP